MHPAEICYNLTKKKLFAGAGFKPGTGRIAKQSAL